MRWTILYTNIFRELNLWYIYIFIYVYIHIYVYIFTYIYIWLLKELCACVCVSVECTNKRFTHIFPIEVGSHLYILSRNFLLLPKSTRNRIIYHFDKNTLTLCATCFYFAVLYTKIVRWIQICHLNFCRK